MNKIRILGIDPALRNTGMAIADYDTVTGKLNVINVSIVKTERSSDKVVRRTSDDLHCARALVTGMKQQIALHRPSLAMGEVPGFSQSARGAYSNGVCCGMLVSLNIPLIEVNPTEVKLAAGGIKTSSKAFMIEWAVKNWPEAGWKTRKVKGVVTLINENEHMADACAAIAAGILTPAFAQAVAMMNSMKEAA